MTKIRLVTLGFEGHSALAVRRGVERFAAIEGAPRVQWTRFDRGVLATPDQLATALDGADAFVIQAVHEPAEAEVVRELVVAHPDLTVVPVQPNASEVLSLARIAGFGTDPEQTRAELALAAGVAARSGQTVPPRLEAIVRVLPVIGSKLPAEAPGLAALARIGAAARSLCPDNVCYVVRVLAATLRPDEVEVGTDEWPESLPDGGFWHPAIAVTPRWEEFARASRARWTQLQEDPVGRIILVAMPSQVFTENAGHLEALIETLESRGIEVIGWLGNLAALGDPGTVAGVPDVDLWVNASGFTLTGSHGQPNIEFDVEMLTERDTPQLAPVPLFRQTMTQWRESRVGLPPAQVAMQLAIPELEGAAVPLILGGRDPETDTMVALDDHVERVAGTVARTVCLRHAANADKRVAIVLFGYHAAHGTVGTASHLDVFASLHRVLRRMAGAGYTVEVPPTPEALIDLIVTDGGGGRRTRTRVAGSYHAAEHTRTSHRHAERAVPRWGRPPGEVDTDGVHIEIGGVQLGNVFVGVQPSFGYDDDPVSLLFADPPDSVTPSHSFIAFYTWIREVFGADALLHFGTHGALEFMPGKQAGLDPDDWANLLVGDLPHFYLYCMNNPSEGTIAKRRSQATLASYLTPPLDRSGTYGLLGELSDGVRAALGHDDPARRATAAAALVELADRAHLEVAPTLAETDPDGYLREVQARVDEVEQALIPIGMHVVDQGIAPDEIRVLLRAACDYERPDNGLPALTIELERELTGGVPVTQLPPDDAGRQRVEGRLAELVQAVVADQIQPDTGDVSRPGEVGARWHWFLAELRDRLAGNDEVGALLRALDGGYLRPAPGGDPARQLAALPTGRNTHALDPQRVPTPLAVKRGTRTATALLDAARAEDGTYPETVAVVLWGIDNVKNGGEACAQVFALLGVEPVTDALGRVNRFQITPLEELGRPRIDVVCTGSGVFRDIFTTTIELLDRAVRAVAELDEPPGWNFVRAHALDQAAELGISVADAATRIWSAPPGSYGSGVNHVVDAGQWETNGDLGDIYVRRMAYAYGHRLSGQNRERLLRRSLGSVRVTFQNIDSAETSLADTDHYFEFLGGITAATAAQTGERPRAMVSDSYAARPKVRDLDDAMRLESRTRLLNPKWYEAHLEHGYQGVAAITRRLENSFGMQATTGSVDDWVFSEAAATFLFDDKLRERMEELNPASVKRFTDRLLEAHERGLWDAGEHEVERLDELSERLDGVIEGVVEN